MTWADVEETVQANSEAYHTLLQVRADHRAGTKKVKRAELAWREAVDLRAAALEAHWTEEDGWWGDPPKHSLARVLQRYYAETVVPKTKGGKRK